jgi:RNA polymerase sigma-B factor
MDPDTPGPTGPNLRHHVHHDRLPREQRMTLTAELLGRLPRASDEQRDEILEEVILLNRCVAESIAVRYAGRGIASDDLRQVAYEGLVKAVQRFDPESGKDLLTFAVPTIRGELRRHFRDHGWSVRPPRRIQELQQRINRADEDLRQRLGREPTTDEVAEDLGIEVAEYDRAMEAYGCFSPTSLDQPTGIDGGRSLGETLVEEAPETSASEARLTLAPVVRELPARDRRILYLRFFEDRTQSEIGDELGVTQMQVSRLLSGIFDKLREAVGETAD